VPCREHTSKALRYGTCSQGISQFHLHTPHTSANGMNHRLPAFAFPAEAGTHLPTPEGWKAELATVKRIRKTCYKCWKVQLTESHIEFIQSTEKGGN